MAITFTSVANAQNNNYKLDGPFTVVKTFKVYGTCEMCKHRIEISIGKLSGIWSADWNVDSKSVVVKYDRSKIDMDKIEKIVADAGHDTDKFMAKEEVFNKLPECCQYQRKS